MSIPKDWWQIALLVIVLLGVGWLSVVDRPRTWVKPPSDIEVAEAWLRCIDCRGPFLKRIHETPAKNRDTVTRFLSSALLEGLDSARATRLNRDLLKAWQADSLYRTRTRQLTDTLRNQFLTRYRIGFEIRWRSRAAIALGVISGRAALAALDSVLSLPRSTKGDSIVHRHAERAKAGAVLAGGSGAPPATGTPTGGISGTVLNIQGTPLDNVSVAVVGTSIAAVTGNNGQFTLSHVPPGSYTLHLRRIGFPLRTAPVTITAGQTVNQNFTLQP